METANVNDPTSLETLYSKADFEKDARLNAQDKTTVLHGLMILSMPGDDGSFSITRANRQVGEVEDTSHSIFVSPRLSGAESDAFVQNDTDYGGPVEQRDPPRERTDPYRAFLDDVLQAARTARFAPAVPAEKLKGFRGG
ncbi:hypothetical protein [Azospirillum rugosum]|uniref:Uncharacterized protein n=1 Tax=Azospirillum rugosum TaxID=416170 RepID=A0ABS4ST49_9PROT|nr:hypothetical protein [Azospirillum rugosum]MBP2295736.1 hypothetical protein [Azospirillum rugosum]MDQ0529153.1 hypothetical protein [Azospirillum rugosum]